MSSLTNQAVLTIFQQYHDWQVWRIINQIKYVCGRLGFEDLEFDQALDVYLDYYVEVMSEIDFGDLLDRSLEMSEVDSGRDHIIYCDALLLLTRLRNWKMTRDMVMYFYSQEMTNRRGRYYEHKRTRED